MKWRLLPFGDVFAVLMIVFLVLSLSIGRERRAERAPVRVEPAILIVGNADPLGLSLNPLFAIGTSLDGTIYFQHPNNQIATPLGMEIFQRIRDKSQLVAFDSWGSPQGDTRKLPKFNEWLGHEPSDLEIAAFSFSQRIIWEKIARRAVIEGKFTPSPDQNLDEHMSELMRPHDTMGTGEQFFKLTEEGCIEQENFVAPTATPSDAAVALRGFEPGFYETTSVSVQLEPDRHNDVIVAGIALLSPALEGALETVPSIDFFKNPGCWNHVSSPALLYCDALGVSHQDANTTWQPIADEDKLLLRRILTNAASFAPIHIRYFDPVLGERVFRIKTSEEIREEPLSANILFETQAECERNLSLTSMGFDNLSFVLLPFEIQISKDGKISTVDNLVEVTP